ncbi:MAG: sulfotransferase [Pseudomonadota bacterium]
MALPDFFVIGAAKAGTTSLYALLDQHPQIFMPEVKEPEFFARDDLYNAPGALAGYEASYDGARAGQIIGEASTIYSLSPFFPDTAARIHAHVPQARIIYVLREPVARAYSFYQQIIKNYQNATRDYAVHRSFEEFVLPARHAKAAPAHKVLSVYNAHLPDTPELCLAGSDYLMQIDAYLRFFPRDRILFLKFEDFVADRPAALAQITAFLGVPPLPPEIFAQAQVTRNVSSTHFGKMGEEAKVESLKRRFGPAMALKSILPTGLRQRLLNWARQLSPESTDHLPPPMSPQTRALLQTRFAPQIDALSEQTGLDLDSWRPGPG